MAYLTNIFACVIYKNKKCTNKTVESQLKKKEKMLVRKQRHVLKQN